LLLALRDREVAGDSPAALVDACWTAVDDGTARI
jgi:hypothetical protein